MASDIPIFEDLIPGLPDDLAIECVSKVSFLFRSKLQLVCRKWRSVVSSSYFISKTSEYLIFLIHSHNNSNFNQRRTYRATLYDPIANIYHTHPSLSIAYGSQCVAIGGKLIILGGFDCIWGKANIVRDVEIVDTVTGQYRRGKPMPVARASFACAVVGSLIYISGGYNNEQKKLKSVVTYDLVADVWQSLPDMIEKRNDCTGISMNDKFFVLGGATNESQGIIVPYNSGESYNPQTLRWEKEDEELCCDLPLTGFSTNFSDMIFVVRTREGERLWHLQCKGPGNKFIKEYDRNAKKWKVVANVPEGMDIRPSITVVGGGHTLFLVGSEYKRGMSMPRRSKRQWEDYEGSQIQKAVGGGIYTFWRQHHFIISGPVMHPM